VGCGATVVVGGEDGMAPAAGGQALCDPLEGHWEVVEGAGHMLMVEDPATVRRLIVEALRHSAAVPAAAGGT
jgi:pimeloyl-ACP methyl ester carboxylesterase